MDQLAKRLDAGNHPRDHVVQLENLAVNFDHAIPSGDSEPAEEATVVTGVGAETFGDSKHQLPVRHRGADRVRYRLGGQQRSLLMATGAQTPLAAGKRDEHLVGAVAAADAGKTKVQIPAAEELASHFADDGPPNAVAP